MTHHPNTGSIDVSAIADVGAANKAFADPSGAVLWSLLSSGVMPNRLDAPFNDPTFLLATPVALAPVPLRRDSGSFFVRAVVIEKILAENSLPTPSN